MGYLIAQILLYLLIAATVGFLSAWLIRDRLAMVGRALPAFVRTS